MRDVVLAAGKEVVQSDDIMAFMQEPFTEMAAQEAGPAGNQNPHQLLPSWIPLPALPSGM